MIVPATEMKCLLPSFCGKEKQDLQAVQGSDALSRLRRMYAASEDWMPPLCVRGLTTSLGSQPVKDSLRPWLLS